MVTKRPNFPRQTVKRLRAILNDARRHGLEATNREHRDNFVDWHGGMSGCVNMVNPYRGKELKEEFDRFKG